MRISVGSLNSNLAKRVAFLVLLSAGIPFILITTLSVKNTYETELKNEHRLLVNESNKYAMEAFGSLLIAKNALLQLEGNFDKEPPQKIIALVDQFKFFNSVINVSTKGDVLYQYGATDYYTNLPTALKQQILNESSKLRTFVLNSSPESNIDPKILLIYRLTSHQSESLLITAIDSKFLWGPKPEYPSNINVCAYQLQKNTKTEIFCSNDEHKDQDFSNKNLSGSWELFLRAEFNDDSWLFTTTKLEQTTGLKSSFLQSYDFIATALISLLLVALLSLQRIRATLEPLEELTNGAKKITEGHFSPISIDERSEFSDLAKAFNQMSISINEKISTLKTLSEIDSVIASKLNVEDIVNQVVARMHGLKPNSNLYIFRVEEKTNDSAHCSVTISSRDTTLSKRVSIPISEVQYIKSFKRGHPIEPRELSNQSYHKILAEFGDQHFWGYPMLWQNKLNGFIYVGSQNILTENEVIWDEFRELASRISISISSQSREQELIRRSQHDMLTGLPNRTLLEDRLNQAIEQSNRSKKPVWVIFIDIDRFKYINDSMGHHLGDQVLLSISKRLKDSVREVDTVARFGGDEFVIVLNTDSKDSINSEILSRILNTVAQPIQVDNLEISTTCSIGVSVYPDDSKSSTDLIKYADIAMYRAKELGKNNFQFFTDALNQQVDKQMRIYSLLRGAVDRHELSLLYQPKVDITTQKIIGVEALIRWNSPELGFVSPLEFISIAEETGLIIPIGDWVMRTACAEAVNWQRAGHGNLLMSVNVSAKQFTQENFYSSIISILNETGLKGEFLDIELTESLLFEHTDIAIEKLNQIKKAGISISIDDFGTGYSNLAHLNNLAIDTIKIDKSFIDAIEKDTLKAPIVDTVILLAKSLNMNLVAEGVESYDQVVYLSARGCNIIQGYYFSKPVRAEIISGMLKPQQL
jgi:diguanylate cyclase (GGDEF)-like protein